MVEPETSYILAVDFGSTILAVKIYNKDDVVASTSVKVSFHSAQRIFTSAF